MKPHQHAVVLLILLLSACASPTARCWAARPSAMALFPEETVLFIRTADASLLIERLQQIGLVRMMQDPAMQPFTANVTDSLAQSYAEQAEDKLGIAFDQLQKLPQGELAFGVVMREPGEAEILLIGEFRHQAESASQMLANAQERVEQQGGTIAEQALRADTATVMRFGKDKQRTIGVVRRDDVFVASSDQDLLASVLDRWDGVTVAPASETAGNTTRYANALEHNRVFANSLRECLQGREEPPQAIGFIDPIGMFRTFGGKQPGINMGLAALPVLGVDAYEGGALAAWFSSESWDSLFRGFFRVDNPRAGIVRALRLATGPTAPHDCVPASVNEYLTLSINPQQVMDDLRSAIDRLAGEGFFDKRVDGFSEAQLGFNLQTELLPIATGRISTVKAFDPESTSPIEQTLLIIEVNDPEQGKVLIKKLAEQSSKNMNRKVVVRQFAEGEYWELESAEEDRVFRFNPCWAIMGQHLVLGNSAPVIKQMLESHAGAAERLSDSLQFRLVQSRLKRLAAENQSSLLWYTQPEPSIRRYWQVAAEAADSEWMQNSKHPVMAAVRAALEQGELPPVEEVLKYFPAGGAVVYDTPHGYQAISFSFRAQ